MNHPTVKMIYYFRDPDTVELIPVTEDCEPQFRAPPAPTSLMMPRYFINFMFNILSIFCFSEDIIAAIEKLSPLTSTRLDSSGDGPSKKRVRLDKTEPPPIFDPDQVMECHYTSPEKKNVSVPITFPKITEKGDHTVSRESTMESCDDATLTGNGGLDGTLVENSGLSLIKQYNENKDSDHEDECQ